ncbi:MAG: hypothetical protein K2Q22_04995 [Cytophagales bacterium]|nr:hypothetical protein [Cytophagales bacterium]
MECPKTTPVMTKITEEKIEEVRMQFTDQRFTLREMLIDFWYNIIHMERKKVVYTAIDLTFRPGTAISNVIAGYRQYLYNPLEYIILVTAIISLLNFRYHFFSNEFTQSSAESEISAYSIQFLNDNKSFFDGFFKYSEEYPSIVNIVAIPVFSVISYLFFWGYQRNFAESLIINSYITAQQLLFLIFLVPFDEFSPNSKHILIPVYTMGTLIYNVWVYTGCFEGKMVSKIIRGILSVSIAYLAQFPVNVAFYYFFEPFLKYLPEL